MVGRIIEWGNVCYRGKDIYKPTGKIRFIIKKEELEAFFNTSLISQTLNQRGKFGYYSVHGEGNIKEIKVNARVIDILDIFERLGIYNIDKPCTLIYSKSI